MRKNLLFIPLIFLMIVCMGAYAYAQNATIQGTVSDPQGLPLVGATVALKGTAHGTTTDAQGNYVLANIKPGSYRISVFYIGFLSWEAEISVKEGTLTKNFTLEESSENLDEVVIIGYGTQQKKDLTGSVSSINSDDFQKGSVTTPEQLIAGKVAGVSVTSNSGAPGSGSTIRIRGGASLNATNDPLIVIDGVPLSNSGISGVANPLSMINPNDIANFTILKDASATAIYGSRASNGVILITTKKGKSGKPVIDFNSLFSISKVTDYVSVLSSHQFRDFVNEKGSSSMRELLGEANTNWQKEIYQTARTTDNNISISGATKHLPYRLAAGFLSQTGVLMTDKLERSSLALNLSPSLFDDHLKIDINLKGSQNKSRFANHDAIKNAVLFDPTKPVWTGGEDFGGYYEWLDPSSATGLKQLAPRNPVALLALTENRGTARRSIGNVQLDYKLHFLPDLHLNMNVGYDVSKGEGTNFVPENAASHYKRFKDDKEVLHSGLNNQYKQTQENKLLEFYMSYSKDVESIDSRIEAVGGYAYQSFSTKNYNFPDYTANGVEVTAPNYPFDIPENKLISFYGRLNYTFKERYLFTATVRSDGSSRFSPENRWSTFPSAAFAWQIKKEGFLKDVQALSDLKLRLGYGITGQQGGINNYDYISYYNLSSQTSQYEFGDSFYQLYSPGGYYYNRKWEQTATSNIGIDFGFLSNRIQGSIDYYSKETKDLLNLIVQPAGTNFSNQIVANVGNMENKGLELNLQGEAIRKDNMQWDIGFNITYNQNKITKLTTVPSPDYPGNAYQAVNGGTGTMVLINSVGYPRGSFYVYQQVYNEDGKPIDGVFVDRKSDDIINSQDLHRYKSIDPKVYLGLSSNFQYKDWSIGFSARANLGNYMYNNIFSSTGVTQAILNPIGILGNGSTNVLESGLSGTNDKNVLSDYYIQNASFLRMDNINLTRHVGSLFNNKGNLTISANVQNAFVITKYEGSDPEISSGVDFDFYPRPRTFVLGLNLIF